MSRIGRIPITISEGVTVDLRDRTIVVKGPKGSLEYTFPSLIKVTIGEKELVVSRINDSRGAKSAHGLARQLIANLITGVTSGFSRRLELKGVGYRAASESGDKLQLNVGYSHPVIIEAPANIEFKVEKNLITVTGIDKQIVGEVAAKIRKVRPPEPYKGKGIMYQGELIRRKAGKAAKTTTA